MEYNTLSNGFLMLLPILCERRLNGISFSHNNQMLLIIDIAKAATVFTEKFHEYSKF